MIDFETLYCWVKGLPIVDWHNHLDMRMLAEDKPLGSLYEVWVKSDPYKHRAMRICGEPERLITGGNGQDARCPSVGCANGQDARCPSESGVNGTTGETPVADESEKWAAWMRTLPKLVGNPIFVWAKMELEWLGLDAEPYLHGRGVNISLACWTPSKMLKKFGVEYLSPCVGAGESSELGQRASCPLEELGQRASRPLTWTAPEVKEFPLAQASISSHFSHTLAAGCSHSRNLPHIGQSSTLVFATFRLADSLPQSRLDELAAIREEWLRKHPEPWDEAACSEWESASFQKIEEWLDAGLGSCILANPALRKVVEDAMEHFNDTGTTGVPPVEKETGTTGISPVGKDLDNGRPARCEGDSHLYSNGQDARCPSVGCANGQDATPARASASRTYPPSEASRASGGYRGASGWGICCPSGRYRLHSYVVMPNHVHVLFELFDGADIQKILHSWKSFTAKKLNRLTGRGGRVWKEEYYDRLIRNGKHYSNTIRYIRRNGEVAEALAERNGRDARCPSVGCVNGQDARCPSVVPSLRMNAGDKISVETLEKFHAVGCRVVDVSVDDVAQLSTSNSQLSTVAAFAAAHGWTMLLHLGALRETSARLRAAAGPAGGFAGMRSPVDPAAVAAFLNALETGTTGVSPVEKDWDNGRPARWGQPLGQRASRPLGAATGTTGIPPVGEKEVPSTPTGKMPVVPVSNGQDARSPSRLPRTILLSLNPEAHAQLAVLSGSFVEEGVPGKVQLGPAWWWCDHEEGIRDVLEKNAAYGVLSTFVGMTTDSRSLLSFVRHDYFRRILCKWVAEKVASGAFPGDESLLRPMLENVCYRNAMWIFSHKEHKDRKEELK